MTTRLDPLEHLERSDKWYLGAGSGAMYAPLFPRWLDRFGFWDEAYFVDVPLERLFTVLVLNEDERPVETKPDRRRWTPDALTQTFGAGDLRMREDKVVTEGDSFVSRITVNNDGRHARRLHVVLWSLQDRNLRGGGERATSAEDATHSGDYLAFTHVVDYGDEPYSDRPAENAGWGERAAAQRMRPLHRLHVALGGDRPPVSAYVGIGERAEPVPAWRFSLMPEKFSGGTFSRTTDTAQTASNSNDHLHLYLHFVLDVPSGEQRSIQLGAHVGLDRDSAPANLRQDLSTDVTSTSRARWQDYYGSVPYFECSDPFLQRYYWYRWYGLRLLTVDIGGHTIAGEDGVRFEHPCVLEGIGGFRSHISYSAQCHVREAAWMRDPRLAMGCMEGLFAAQENSGYLPGHLYLFRGTRGFYHANWGAAAWQLYQITGDVDFVGRIYPALSRYGEYFERERDREDMHLYDVVDQGETGQEYSSRYLFADTSADDWRKIQLKGVDATVYVYLVQQGLAKMAALLGKDAEAEVWDGKATATANAVRTLMWDPERGFFFDVHPRTGERSPCASVCGFYPFVSDIAGREHLPAIYGHLLNPSMFWTPWPVPSASVDDPNFSADAEWRGRRMSCPWNGRVWPMTSSHVCDALGQAALRLDPALKPHAANLIDRFVRMMFYDRDPARPNSFEHYNPFTGTPSMYRGIDDYQHSYVVDLLMRYLVGIQPSDDRTLVIDPLPFAVERFRIEQIRYKGHDVGVSWDATDGLRVTVDGASAAQSVDRSRLVVPIGS